MKIIIALLLLCIISDKLVAQTDPEFPKEFIMHLKLHNGMVSNLSNAPDQYVGGLQLIPQYTFVKNLIRGGLIADGYYTGKKFQAAFGPTVSIKLKSLNIKPFGGAGNLHLNLDHLWGTNNERLFGGGISADLLNRIVIGFSAHRDYGRNTWWFQNSISVRISKLKKAIVDL